MPVKIICGDEIFRIKVALSFSKLQEVVSGRINKPRSAFTLSYDDSDGDRIVIHSDEDLGIAFNELSVLKLFCSVRERPASAPSKLASVAASLDTRTATITLAEECTRALRDDLSSRIIALQEKMHAIAVTAERQQVGAIFLFCF